MSDTALFAMKLFRILHGKGDSGSEHAFLCQNPAAIDGWIRLAKYVRGIKRKASKPIYGPIWRTVK